MLWPGDRYHCDDQPSQWHRNRKGLFFGVKRGEPDSCWFRLYLFFPPALHFPCYDVLLLCLWFTSIIILTHLTTIVKFYQLTGLIRFSIRPGRKKKNYEIFVVRYEIFVPRDEIFIFIDIHFFSTDHFDLPKDEIQVYTVKRTVPVFKNFWSQWKDDVEKAIIDFIEWKIKV